MMDIILERTKKIKQNMINIDKYIKKFTPDQIGRNQEFYEQLMEYYGENIIPNRYKKLYDECKLSYDYIH